MAFFNRAVEPSPNSGDVRHDMFFVGCVCYECGLPHPFQQVFASGRSNQFACGNEKRFTYGITMWHRSKHNTTSGRLQTAVGDFETSLGKTSKSA